MNYIESNTTSNERIIKGIWSVDCLYNPENNGRIFNYKFLVSQTMCGQGCAYSINSSYDPQQLLQLLGRDFLKCNITDVALLISLIDSVYRSRNSAIDCEQQYMDATSSEKLRWRTEIIFQESQKILGKDPNKKVVNVGVVGDIIRKFIQEGYTVLGTDFDKNIVGSTLFGRANIYDGTETNKLISEADLAIVTGMTISTQTLDGIIETAKTHNTKLIIYAETGANLAPYYLEEGVDCYISEEFPFYIFNGNSKIKIYRKKQTTFEA